ncbi:MAG: DUF3048 domain-containing protein, partial [Pseudonocardia sp.]|nr:DUF3048 domain-containing protein [Pseudonocardia sp.]
MRPARTRRRSRIPCKPGHDVRRTSSIPLTPHWRDGPQATTTEVPGRWRRTLAPLRRAAAAGAARLAGLAAGVVFIVACGSTVQPQAPPPTASAPAPPSSQPAPPAPSPGPPVLAVKIDNASEARPAKGLGAADLIYVEPVEGGVSRMIAVFAAQLPPVVGPVRSARETDLQLLPEFGHPALAFSGAAPALLPRIAHSAVRDVSAERAPGAYFRDRNRAAPHNMFVHPAQLSKGARWSASSRPLVGAAPGGGVPNGHQVVRYRAASVAFDWSGQAKQWLVSFDGAPAISDNHRLGASTVVVQQVPIHDSATRDVAGSPSPVANTVGHGHALVLRDGEAFEATWSRPNLD